MEQIFKRGVIIDKHLQHQRDLFQNFIDFKVFGSVRHANLWRVLRSFNKEEGLAQTIHALYENSQSAVLLNSQPLENTTEMFTGQPLPVQLMLTTA